MDEDGRYVSPEAKLAPFNPTDITAQKLAFEALQLQPSDVLYDLGCGDGRFLIYCCTNMDQPCTCVGVEYDKVYSDRATSASADHESITIMHANALTVDLSNATAIFVYLVPEGLKCSATKLHDLLRRGGRIASYMFSVPNLTPASEFSSKGGCKVRYYDRSSLPKDGMSD